MKTYIAIKIDKQGPNCGNCKYHYNGLYGRYCSLFGAELGETKQGGSKRLQNCIGSEELFVQEAIKE